LFNLIKNIETIKIISNIKGISPMLDCCFKINKDNEKPLLDEQVTIDEVYKPKRKYMLADIIENKQVTWVSNPSLNSLDEFNILLKKMRTVTMGRDRILG